jgi:hypothetical protein
VCHKGATLGVRPNIGPTTCETMSPLSVTITVVENRHTSTTKLRADIFINRAQSVLAVCTAQSQFSARWKRQTAAKATASHSWRPRPVSAGW